MFFNYQDYIWIRRQALQCSEDDLFTLNVARFLDEEDFLRSYDLGVQINSWHAISIRWRAYIACCAGAYALKLDGAATALLRHETTCGGCQAAAIDALAWFST